MKVKVKKMSEILIDVPQEYEGERIDKFLSILLVIIITMSIFISLIVSIQNIYNGFTNTDKSKIVF